MPWSWSGLVRPCLAALSVAAVVTLLVSAPLDFSLGAPVLAASARLPVGECGPRGAGHRGASLLDAAHVARWATKAPDGATPDDEGGVDDPEVGYARGAPRLPRAAVAVQGRASELRERWVLPFAKQLTGRTRRAVTLFLLTYDEPLGDDDLELVAAAAADAGAPPHVAAIFVPNTTWTTGRNTLARLIYQAEEARGASFDRWSFFDQDMGPPRLLCNSVTSNGASACSDGGRTTAFDQAVRSLMDEPRLDVPYRPYDQGLGPPPCSLACPTCTCLAVVDYPDPVGNVFHREAVPVLLPYVADDDDTSWQYSGHAHFYVLSNCLRDATYHPTGYHMIGSGDHTDYKKSAPNWRLSFSRYQRAWPHVAKRDRLPLDYPVGSHWAGWDLTNASEVARVAAAWRSPLFAECLADALPRFCSHMNDGAGDRGYVAAPLVEAPHDGEVVHEGRSAPLGP